MREILPYDIPVDDAIPRFSHCFDIERAFRARPESASSPESESSPESASSPQEDLVLYDLAEYLHKRLIFMENELCRLSRGDYLDTIFGGPIPSLKDIRLSLREILSPPDPPFPCPAPGCREIFPSLLVRREHFKTSSNQSHLFYKSILDETYCFPCGTEFDSLKSLAMHNQRVHRKIRCSGIDTFQRICTQTSSAAQRSTEQPAEDSIQPAKRICTRRARYTVRFHDAQKNPPAHEPPSSSRQSQPGLQQLNKHPVGPINDYRPEIQPPADFGTIQRDTPVDGFFQPFSGNIHDEIVHDLHNFNPNNPHDELVRNLLHFHPNNPTVEGFQYLQPFASPADGPNQPPIDSQTVSGNPPI
ncbi:hypothetical protein AJ79_01442 [Helicocarpus griseus UAMH5409]|uniref:C2H2-type domain-containing protein n=1 Tax=Helicocarpus griseus UAMH5409 TaxID=1447875 RepID=A0A2B7Y804_9EURO|nr:hypothetical protein AJ79_01442 [Helicocarpus griseus UAMH5409]